MSIQHVGDDVDIVGGGLGIASTEGRVWLGVQRCRLRHWKKVSSLCVSLPSDELCQFFRLWHWRAFTIASVLCLLPGSAAASASRFGGFCRVIPSFVVLMWGSVVSSSSPFICFPFNCIGCLCCGSGLPPMDFDFLSRSWW